MKYNKILVAIDNTDESENVVMSAMLVAEDYAEVHLMTAVEPLSNIYGSMIWSPVVSDTHSLEESLVEQSKVHLTEMGLRHGIEEANVHVMLGSPASNIRDLAEKIGADLIVVGTHGRHGVGLILGSTANSVLHGVNTDVLVVRLPTDG